MDVNSQDTLRRIEENDYDLTELWIGNYDVDGGFKSSDASDYSRLGTAIGNNNHLEDLIVALDDEDEVLGAANTEFFDGLKRNSSISDLTLDCCYGYILVGGIGHTILESYQKNNNNLLSCSPR